MLMVAYNGGMLDMLAEVDALPGIGPRTKEALGRAGIFSVRDLFYYLPRDYDDYQEAQKIADLQPGRVTIVGKVIEVKNRMARSRRLHITEATISDGEDAIRAVWFNQPYRETQFSDKNKAFVFSGMYEFRNGRYQLSNPKVHVDGRVANFQSEANGFQDGSGRGAAGAQGSRGAADVGFRGAAGGFRSGAKTVNSGKFQPVYAQKSVMKPDDFKNLLYKLRPEFAKVPDLLPITSLTPEFVKKGARREALFNVHFAEDKTEAEAARRYLAYEELFELVLAARLNKDENRKLRAHRIDYDDGAMHRLLDGLDFQLTDAQKKAAWEIIQDLGKATPMNRLLQGDVGSGKTIVAATAILQAVSSGFQVALLAPTAILAAQHAEGLYKILKPLGVEVALLTGATKRKGELKKRIAEGEVDLVVGTHAIITDDTRFRRLALCIIDEQHRFGVAQRQKLLLKGGFREGDSEGSEGFDGFSEDGSEGSSRSGFAPHLLSMTATPIPRSLQLTVFGDLDVSIINQMPKGRKPVKTKVLTETGQREELYPLVKAEIAAGRQAYWICKTIEDSSRQETISVKRQAEKLQAIFPKARIEFLHGRMKPGEKDEIMERFAAGKTDILVSTTVVEVGVDVPNATVMVIMDAESYGLAQIHQLRGRVGRSDLQSYCYLITTAERPTRRLRELEKSNDGFHLAEVDLKIRGPGEIYGSLQHGVLDLRIATLSDTELIRLAQRHAEEVAKAPENMVKYRELCNSIKKYQQLTTLN